MAAHIPHPLPDGFEGWSTREQLEYVTHLWEIILEGALSVPVHEWQRDAVDRAKQTMHAQPEAGQPWQAEHDRLRERVRQRLADRGEE